MRITETKLKRIIRKIIVENEMLDNQLQMAPPLRGSGALSPDQIFDVIKQRMRYANSEIVRGINQSVASSFLEMSKSRDPLVADLVQPFMEFVNFCNRYCDNVHCGPSKPSKGQNNWQQNETAMAEEGSKLGFSTSDCSVICVEVLG